jgi:hypothetical protein
MAPCGARRTLQPLLLLGVERPFPPSGASGTAAREMKIGSIATALIAE